MPALGALPANCTAVTPTVPLNAVLPIVVMLAGNNSTPVSPVAPLKALAPIVVSPAGSVSWPVSPVAFKKAFAAIVVTTQPAAQTELTSDTVPGIVRSARTRLAGPVIVIVSGTVPLAIHVRPVAESVPEVASGVPAVEGDTVESPLELCPTAVNV